MESLKVSIQRNKGIKLISFLLILIYRLNCDYCNAKKYLESKSLNEDHLKYYVEK